MNTQRPQLALTQGDPAGIGPEILLAGVAADAAAGPLPYRPLLLIERVAVEAVAHLLPAPIRTGLRWLPAPPTRAELAALPNDVIAAFDPVGSARRLELGTSGAADAAGALAALDAGIGLARSAAVDALVTAPVSKASIARHCRPGFVGHTEYLAAACGLERYGRDYLMAFLAPAGAEGGAQQVALLSTHLPLRDAIAAVRTAAVLDALRCLERHAGGRIAVAGLNPHAGEGGLLGSEDAAELEPAVAAARAEGIDAHGPASADSLFARARQGAYDWVLALYHDQGLIAVKTASFGRATNWTLGLPILRTSVDHGTAFELAGTGRADAGPLRAVLATTCELVAGRLPLRAAR